MKPLNIILTVLIAGFATAHARAQTQTQAPVQLQESSPLRFETIEWSFGEIGEEGGNVSHIFEFTNDGATPVSIDRVVASCGCTTPDYPKTPIAPGKKANINVTFDPRGMPGDFTKTIGVMAGGGKYHHILTITGHVVPRPKTIEEEYPHDVGGGLRISSTLLTFRTMMQGSLMSMVSKYVNTSVWAVTLAFESDDRSAILDINAPETVCAGCRGDITFTYDLSKGEVYGPIHDIVRPVVDGAASRQTIYTSVTGIDNFEGVDMDLAPRFFIDASFHDFGEVRRRTVPHTFILTASNQGSRTLHIRSVSAGEGLQSTLRAGMTIAPGASLPFEVIFYSNKYSPGEVQGSIQLVVDDPMRPTREIRISAIVQ